MTDNNPVRTMQPVPGCRGLLHSVHQPLYTNTGHEMTDNNPGCIIDRLHEAERKLVELQKALAGMVESYHILLNESPLGKHEIAAGVIRGAFINEIQRAMDLLPQHTQCLPQRSQRDAFTQELKRLFVKYAVRAEMTPEYDGNDDRCGDSFTLLIGRDTHTLSANEIIQLSAKLDGQ
jgi:hypothetical protein